MLNQFYCSTDGAELFLSSLASDNIRIIALATGLLKLGQMQLRIVKWGFILGIVPIVSAVMNTFWYDFGYLGVWKEVLMR